MRETTRVARFMAFLLASAVTMTVAAGAQTPTAGIRQPSEQVLFSFSGPPGDGLFPNVGLIQDSAGNFYGTSSEGGVDCPPVGCGTVFKLSPTGTETILYTFPGGSSGGGPNGLLMDPSGNLYGTTQGGGNNLSPGGVIFKITASGTESTIYSFQPADGDGSAPTSTLIRDSSGNLYGTTTNGGSHNAGVVFKFNASGYSILYQFTGGADGAHPYRSRLVMDSAGNLYGLTNSGGAYGYGTVFKLTSAGQESVLYSFTGGNDGANPLGDLLLDSAGNFYAVTTLGGANGNGVVFKVSSSGQESVLYTFGPGLQGDPQSGVLMDSAGNLYGTTTFGGANNRGSVFELTSSGQYNVLYSFSGSADGGRPWGGLFEDTQGNLYGTTIDGGASQAGNVFAVTP
jgi:uncharacterized repeat protein (TIGR03803 family)